MTINRFALVSAAAACALSTTPALGQDGSPPDVSPTQAEPPAAKPKLAPKPKPRPLAVPAATAGPAKAAEPAAASDEAKRLERIERALGDSGILASSPETSVEQQNRLKTQLAQLEEQRRSLEAAIRGGLDAESVKAALTELQRKSEALTRSLAQLDAEQTAQAQPLKSPLALRLEAVEAAIARLEQAHAQPAPTTAEPAATPRPATTQSAASASPGPSLGHAGWKDGFFVESADANYSLRIFGLLDFKFAYQSVLGDVDEFAFSAPFARFGLKGNLFSKSFKYLFLAELGKGSAQLQYYYGDYTLVPDYFAVRVGQQQRPFSRLYLVPIGKGQFVSANPTLKAFGDATDLGLELHNGQPTFEYTVGMFNGTTSKSTFTGNAVVDPLTGKGSVQGGAFANVPKRFQPAFVARVGFNHGGIEPYTESDLEGGGFRAAVGAAGYMAFDLDDDKASSLRGTVDALIKCRGFSTNLAVYAASKQSGAAFGDRALEATGLSVQAGYLVAARVEPVVRYAAVLPKGAHNDLHDLTAGANVYFFKHALKWQNDFGIRMLPQGAQTARSYLYESQLQFTF